MSDFLPAEQAYIFLRFSCAFLILPFSESVLGIFSKFILAGLFAIILPSGTTQQPFEIEYALYNMLVGISVAIPIIFFLEAANFLGELFDSCRGQNISQLFNPLHEGHLSGTALTLHHIFWAQIWLFGSALELFTSLSVPVVIDHDLALFFTKLLNHFVISLTKISYLFIPWAILFIAVELFFGFISKLLPSLTAHQEGFILKSLSGYLLFYLFLTEERVASLVRSF